MWKRYRFHTRAEDYRPIVFNPAFPWWCSGHGDDYSTIVAYLPAGEPLAKYWDDAYDIDETTEERVTFTGRFPKPKWYVPGQAVEGEVTHA